MKRWLLALADRSPSTRRIYLSSLSAFFDWCIAEGRSLSNPCAGLPRPKMPAGENRSLTSCEFERLWSVLPDARAQLIVSLMHGEGLRCAEVAAIRRSDLDLDCGTLSVRGKGYGGKRSRRVYLSPRTRSLIDTRHRPSGDGDAPLVGHLRSPTRPLRPNAISEMASTWMRNAGLKGNRHDGVSAHALRHTAAEEVAAHATDIRQVQQFLGHQNLATTQTYLRREVGGLEMIQAARFG